MVPPPPLPPTTNEGTRSQYERKLARQRQLELMEATASGTAPTMELDISDSSSTFSLRQRSQESARRFLQEENDDDSDPEHTLHAISLSGPAYTGQSRKKGSKSNNNNNNLFDRRKDSTTGVNLMDHTAGVYQEESSSLWFVPKIRDSFNSMFATNAGSSVDMAHTSAFVVRRDRINLSGNPSAPGFQQTSRLGPLGTLLYGCFDTPSKRRRLLLRLLSIVAIVTCLLLTLSVTIFAHPTEQQMRQSNTNRFNEILDHILLEGVSSTMSFLDYSSPQHHALRWISYSDKANLDPLDPMILQRYALAVFYYSSYLNFQKKAGQQQPITFVDDKGIELQKEGVPNPGWIRKDYWMTERGHCQWYGIECVETVVEGRPRTRFNGHEPVLNLNLTKNHVYGTLPAEFKALNEMESLDLSHNELFGTLPWQLGRAMYQLQYLWLHKNELTGTLPDTMGSLEGIRDLHLGHNGFTGTIPTEMNRLYNIRSLGLDHNELTGGIPDLSMCKKMVQLYLNHNELDSKFPFSVVRLSSLFELHLNDNQLKGTIPPEIESIRHLAYLHLENNELTGEIPDLIFTGLPALREVTLHSNDFFGKLPPDLGQLFHLHKFTANNNRFTGSIPTEWNGMPFLRYLHLYKNELSGVIPDNVGTMTNLLEFWAHDNDLEGEIPSAFAQLTTLESLSLERNELVGTVPLEFEVLSNLKTLRLFDNGLDGEISDQICELRYSGQLSFIAVDCKSSVSCPCCHKCY